MTATLQMCFISTPHNHHEWSGSQEIPLSHFCPGIPQAPQGEAESSKVGAGSPSLSEPDSSSDVASVPRPAVSPGVVHDHLSLTRGCFRCDLNRDEMEQDRLDHLRVAKLLRRVAANSRRRPGTRSLMLDLAAELEEQAAETAAALNETGP